MNNFHPFRIVGPTDFSLEDMADDLGLTRTQKKLLEKMLDEFDISLWFSSHDDHDNEIEPTLELCAFFDGGHVSSADLIDMLARSLEERNEIGDEKEIAVLTRLKTIIDAAISERQEAPI